MEAGREQVASTTFYGLRMQPFPVICETCRSQLRVRSARMIGEIHSCPKCGGMVLIQPPAGWSDGPSEVATTAVKPAKPPSVAPAQPLVAQSFHEIADLSGIDLTTPAGPASGSPSSPAELPAAAVDRWSRWVIWGSVAGSVAIATASLVWSLWPGDDNRVPVSAQAPAITDPPPKREPTQTAESAIEEPTAIVANKPEVATEPQATEAPAEFALPEPPPIEPSVPEPEPQESELQPAAETVASSSVSRPAIDPRDVAPENLDLVLRKDRADGVPPAVAANVAGNDKVAAPPDLQIGDGSEVATRASLEEALASAANQAKPETVRRGPTSADDLPPANVGQLLQLTIPEIDVPRLPLYRAVAMLTELTAIPITLDPAALRMAGVSVGHEVAIRGKQVSAAELIRTTLAGANLQYEQRGNQLIVIRAGAGDLANRNYRIGDLFAPGSPDASAIAQLIQTLVTPESWAGQGGTGQLKVNQDQLAVTQSQSVHYDALIFCERLRKARGVPLQSKYPTALLRTKPLETALAPRLDRRVTFSFVTWTRLPQVFRHWEQASGLTILVDWSALGDVQLAPASTIACAVEGASWREALEEVLTPLGLAWVPVDGSTIQITSRAAAEALQYIDFYSLPRASDAEALVAELREGTPGDHAVVSDAASHSLIVRANAAGHLHVATQLAVMNDAP